MCHNHHFPCLCCHPNDYIRMVQHLIERCLLLRMSRDDCIEALAEHASIRPLITLTGLSLSLSLYLSICLCACVVSRSYWCLQCGRNYSKRTDNSFKNILMLFLQGLSISMVELLKGCRDLVGGRHGNERNRLNATPLI
ncbi:uncharacterized protein LOC122076001 isoform X2 [Macadamia integrifolia]|uniref:uncharacterized protein LOC122076001 isoform X2 n=1 Tax=Macadamia integrifolia TaxID=60698 RepID=UPI001C500BEB|nr:uncharacterized protein LOC122076001 isoform X2 [Macadamia integrifolia]